jgi:prolipoprotein diacylglyceryltransferase
MQQVLFHIPYLGIPIYGYGFMLFLAFIACSWLTAWRAENEGIARTYVHDVIIWLFLGGILGARVTYMIQYQVPLSQFFVIWKGGLVFYGSFFGGVIAYGVWRAVQEGREVLTENRTRLIRWVGIGVVIGLICIAVRTVIIRREDVDVGKALWDLSAQGLAFGAALGGLVGFSFAYILAVQKNAPPNWKFMDIMTPSLALGLALGRVGCLLNGCCFGNVACADCPAIHFPLCAPARSTYTALGYQTAAGFTTEEGGNDLDDRRTRVGAVEPGSEAAKAGLKPGDVIVAVNGMPNRLVVDIDTPAGATMNASWSSLLKYLKQKEDGREFETLGQGKVRVLYDGPKLLGEDLKHFHDIPGLFVMPPTDLFQDLLVVNWPQGETHLALSVKRGDKIVDLPTFRPVGIGLHPTQIYESISALLILLLLTAYYPFRRHYGEVFVLFMLCYSIHRFTNEMLRNDTSPVLGGMTLSQNVSILVLVIAIALLTYLWLKPTREEKEPVEPAPAVAG